MLSCFLISPLGWRLYLHFVRAGNANIWPKTLLLPLPAKQPRCSSAAVSTEKLQQAQPPHRPTQRGDNETKHTWAACYWLLNRQQGPDLNWFPLFLKINMRLMGNWLQWVSTAHAIFYCEQWVRAWNCGWRKTHLGTSRILHGDCWHIGRQIFLSGERHSAYDPAHFWLGLNLHLSLCNLSEGILKTRRFRQMSILPYKTIANITEKLPMLFLPRRWAKWQS